MAMAWTCWHSRIDGVMILGEVLLAEVRAEGQVCWRLQRAATYRNIKAKSSDTGISAKNMKSSTLIVLIGAATLEGCSREEVRYDIVRLDNRVLWP